MRKSFTRLLGLFVLFCMMSLFAVAQTLSPLPGSPAALNVDNRTGSVTLTITFPGDVSPASGVGIIALSTNAGVQLDPIQINGTVSTNPVTGSTATISGKTVEVRFVGTYTEGATYQVTVTNDALKYGAAGTVYGGVAFGGWPIVIADYTAPAVDKVAGVSQFTPLDGAPGVSQTNNLSVLFTEPVALGTGNIGLYTAAGDVVELFDVATSARVWIAGGNTLMIDPTANLVELQKYYVRIAPTAIVDLSAVAAIQKPANAYAGINNNTTWDFWAQDVTKPTATLTAGLTATHTKVARDEKPTLKFTDNMEGGLYPASLVLKTAAAGTIPTTAGGATSYFSMTENGFAFVNFTATYKGNNVFEFAPTAANGSKWTSDAVYIISLIADKVEDNQGNQNAAATFTFTADDFLAPSFTVATAAAASGSAAYLNSTSLFLNTTMADGSGVPVSVKYLIVPAGTTVTAANVVANGVELPRKVTAGVTSTTDHYANATQYYTSAGMVTLASNTLYDVHFVATDNATVTNTSTALTSVLNVRTNDTEAPVPTTTATLENGSAVTMTGSAVANNIKYNSTIVLTFNEDVDGVQSGDIIIKQTNVTPVSTLQFGVDFTAVETAPGVITITGAHDPSAFAAGWLSEATYTIELPSSKVYDVITGTGSANAAAAVTYTMTIEDYKGITPDFKSTSSTATLHNRTDVAKADDIIVTFSSAPHDENGVLLTNANIKNYIQFRRGDGNGVNVGSTDLNPAVSMSINGNVVTINPADDFASETYYGVWVSTLIKDDEGTKLNLYQNNTTPIASTSEFATFKAVDSQSPLITFSTRNNANTAFTTLVDVPVDAKPYIFLSEQVKTTIGGGINILDDNQIRSLIELREGSATGNVINFNVVDVDAAPNAAYGVANTGTVVLIDPIDFPSTYNFASSGTYYLSVTGLQDAAGNPVAGNTTFTVANTSALKIDGVTPTVDQEQVDLAGNIVITFDRNVTKTAAAGLYNLVLTPTVGGAVTVDVSSANAAVTVVGNVVTVPYAGLIANTQYTITMTPGAFVASNGATSPALAATQKFVSKDSQGPRVDLTLATTDVTPNEATNVAITGAKLVLDFDEEVSLGTGVINIKKAELGVATTVATIDMASANFSWATGDKSILNVTIPVTLEYNTKYVVEVPATAFKDKHGNPWEWRDASATPTVADDTYGNRSVSVSAGSIGTPYVLGSNVWDFQTVVDPAPQYVISTVVNAAASTPLDDATNVALNAELTVRFSEPVRFKAPVTGKYLTIRNAADGTAHYTVAFDSPNVTWSWNDAHDALTVQHDALLADKAYYIQVTNNTFEDYAGQAMGGVIGELDVATEWNFSTVDLIKPSVSSLSFNPTDDGTQVDVDANIIVNFTEPVALNTAVAPTWRDAFTVNGAAAPAGTYTLSDDKKTLTVDPSVDLAPATTYVIALVDDAVKDLATTPNLCDTPSKSFVSEDAAAPVVTVNTAVAPYSSTKIKASITVTDFTTVTGAANDIKVYYKVVAEGATPAPTVTEMLASPSYTIETGANKQLEITGLSEKTKYDMYFMAVDNSKNANKTAVTKVVEGALPGGPVLSTTDATKPTISLLTPLSASANVAYKAAGITFKIKWSEEVAKGTGSIVIRKKADNVAVYSLAVGAMTLGNSATGFTNNQLSFTVPAVNFTDLTEYYIELENGFVADVYNTSVAATVADNITEEVYIGNARWTFTTADETKPIVLISGAPAVPQLTPRDNATNVAVEAAGNPLVMVFNEDVVKNTSAATPAYIRIYRTGVATPHEVIPVNSSYVTIGADNRTVTIVRNNVYASEVVYYVTVDANAFYDTASVPNGYLGISNTTDWNFTSKDITAPEVKFFANDGVTALTATAVNPANIATLKIKFWDTVQGVYEDLFKDAAAAPANVSSYVTVKTAAGATVATTSAYVAAPGVITVTPTAPAAFVANQTYTVTLTGGTGTGALEDDATNEVGTSSFTFATIDNLSPTITYTPTNVNAPTYAVDYSVDGIVTIKFNKTIYNSNMLAGVGSTSPNANFTPTAAELKTVNYMSYYETLTPANTVTYDVEVVTPGVEYRLKPTTALKSATSYSVIWNATRGAAQEVYDRLALPSENKLDLTLAQRTTQFTTEDKVAPIVNTVAAVKQFDPAVNALVSTTNPIKIGFNEKVQAGSATGLIEIRYSNGQVFDDATASECTFASAADANGTWWVTIPFKALDKFKSYYVVIPSGAIVDVNSNHNAFVGIQDNTTWYFRTDDGEAPTVDDYSPKSGSNNIPVYSNLVLRMSEDIQTVAGKNLVIYHNNGDANSDGNAVEIIPLNDLTRVSISGSDAQNTKTDIITVNPNLNFDKLGTYYVRIDDGAVKDFAATPNNYAGIKNNTTWYFTITDNTVPSPVMASFSPTANATGVVAKPEIKMVFDIPVAAGTGNIELYEYYYVPSMYMWTEKRVEYFPVTPEMVNGNTVTVTPSANLKDNTIYYVLVDNGAITNTASSKDRWAGISNPFTWRFTTGDNTVPTVTADKASGATGLANSFDVTLTFSETVTGATAGITVTGGTATVTEVTAGTVYKVSVTANDLATVIVKAAASIIDVANNPLVETTFTYSVADNNGPTLTVNPASGTTITTNEFDVTLTFNEDVTVAAADVTVSAGTVAVSGSGKVYTAKVKSPSNTDVVLTVKNTVKDAAGNAFAGDTYTYKVTGDVTAPKVTVLSPEKGTTTATSHPATLEMTFDENVVKGAGKIYIYNGATAVLSFDVTANNVTVSNNKVTVALATGLDKFVKYFIYVDKGFVKDTYGNEYAGINNPTEWTFTTGNFPSGIEDDVNVSFKVYPNPFVNELKVDNASELSRIVITSMTGQKVKEIVNPTSTIQTSELRSGVYFISLYVDDVVAKTERIVKR